MYNNYHLKPQPSLKYFISKLPQNIADYIRLQGKCMNTCEIVLGRLLTLFKDPSLSKTTFMETTGMVMNDIIYCTKFLISDPICVKYLDKVFTDKSWKTGDIKDLAFKIYSKMGPLGEPILPGDDGYEEDIAFNDNEFTFGIVKQVNQLKQVKQVKQVTRDIKTLYLI